jgi:hypothetical protein
MTVLLAGMVVFASCGGEDKTAAKGKDKYEQTKESLEVTEKKTPARFLTVGGHDKRNLLGQTVIKGTLTNNAKVVTYKDVDVELAFYSKTGALLEKDHEVIFETITPGDSKNFKTKYFAPKGTDSVALKVINAKY